MLPWFKKHPEKVIIGFILVILLPAILVAQHFWPHDGATKSTRVSTEQGLFEIHYWQENGATIAFVPLPELPIVDIHVLFPAGSAYDKETPGLAYLTAQMIGEGTKTQDAQSIYETFENVGAQFSASASRDYAALSLRTLSDNKPLETSMEMLRHLLAETTFEASNFARERNRLLAAIKMREQSAGDMASQAFFEEAYAGHPYATPVTGTQDAVEALTAADLENFFRSYYTKNNAVIAISGDISLHQARKIASDLLEELPIGLADTQIPLVPRAQAKKEHIKFPSTQTHILFGMPAMAKGNPDFFAFSVGNHVLGANPLVSQLFNIVRDQHGLAYSVGSHLITLKQPGPFIINLQTRGNEAKKAMALVEKTLDAYMKNGPSKEEIKDAKANINGRFALGLGSNQAITSHIAMLAFYNLPWDYYETYQDNINAVTKDDIERVFKKYLSVNDFVQVSVGEHAP